MFYDFPKVPDELCLHNSLRWRLVYVYLGKSSFHWFDGLTYYFLTHNLNHKITKMMCHWSIYYQSVYVLLHCYWTIHWDIHARRGKVQDSIEQNKRVITVKSEMLHLTAVDSDIGRVILYIGIINGLITSQKLSRTRSIETFLPILGK